MGVGFLLGSAEVKRSGRRLEMRIFRGKNLEIWFFLKNLKNSWFFRVVVGWS